uniref:Putative phenylalaninetRNA ligase alpha subunit isoform X1 n=1 Tax=Rhizophora mucronata TaxID=61149 RepID=A0A2P2M1K4_RHIMU
MITRQHRMHQISSYIMFNGLQINNNYPSFIT